MVLTGAAPRPTVQIRPGSPADPWSSPGLALVLYAAFVLSGAAGLIYESIWTRYLGLFVGHSAYAQVIVLVIFLGGMALGALLVGGRSERLRQPLVAYAVVEGLAGVLGLFFHDVFVATTAVAYDTIFPALPNESSVLVVKWTIAALLILPQSVLLGMTFPLMSAGVLRFVRGRPGYVLGLLYFANSLGAAGGVLLAGFWLVAAAGLPGTLIAAATLNLLVALVAYVGVRWARPAQEVADAGAPTPDVAPAEVPITAETLWRALLAVAFGTAVASFVYEIAWIRMLSLVLGSATHSFELMLSAFILGLAFGALWVHRRADRFGRPIRALGIVQLVMGLAALATLPVYLRSFGWTAALLGALGQSESAYRAFGLARYGVALAVMLPATFCAGMTLPLITRTLLAAGRGERSIGAVYGANTIGSIAGAALAGLVLLPVLGLKWLLIAGAATDMSLGVALLSLGADSARARRLAWGAAAVVAIAALLAGGLNRFDAGLLSSGVFRSGTLPPPNSRDVPFYRDGRTATVTVSRSRQSGTLTLATNGKPDASVDTSWYRWDAAAPRRQLRGDGSTQVLAPLVTLAYAPGAREAAVIGQGSGISSHVLLASPAIRRLVTIEIEPQMLAGSRLFYPANARVFDDPRSSFVLDDAKSYFAAANRRYDLILSEPSNPWVSGVSSLFTLEFYGRVRRYLAPHGVFGQWLHLYELDDGLVLGVLAALQKSFPSYDVYMTSPVDLLIVASNDPALPAPDPRVFALPALRRDLRADIPFSPRMLDELHLADRGALEPVVRRFGGANSDFYPVLDLGAERARFLRTAAMGFIGLAQGGFDVAAALTGRRIPFDTATAAAADVPRARLLALGAALRAGVPVDSRLEPTAAHARHLQYLLDAAFAAGSGPDDWHAWFSDWLTAERDLHGGTAGVADEAFFARTDAFLARHAAPREVQEAVAFVHGLAGWDFAAVARAGEALAGQSREWVPPDALRDGLTVARLRLGDVQGAKLAWQSLADRSQRPDADLRTLLVRAHLEDALERR